MAKGSGPNLLVPEVPLIQVHTNNGTDPMIVKSIKYQAPDLLISCSLRQVTEREGINIINVVIILKWYKEVKAT